MSISQKMFSRGGVNQSQDSTDDAFESTVSMWVQFSTWCSFNAPFKLSIFSEFLVQVDHEKHNLSCKLEHITWAQDKYNTSPARFLKIMIDVFRHVHIHTLPIFFLFCWVLWWFESINVASAGQCLSTSILALPWHECKGAKQKCSWIRCQKWKSLVMHERLSQ